ncbi:MAG: molybdopterin-dependent oxidoreductase [Christensenellales bacterium]|jgi:DMSO/TMAO reductase YedYZ molybdopterin-dependent catalytic subunit
MPQKKRRNKWIIPAVLAVLAVGVAVLATLNKEEVPLDQIERNEVVVKADGAEIGRFSLDTVKRMEKVEFSDRIKETGKAAVKAQFGGVLLRDVLMNIGVDPSEYRNVAYKALDMYTSAGTVDEIMQDGKVYVVYERDGRQTRPKHEGGTGPLEIVIAGEQFSLRNCKFLMEIDFS